MLSGLEVRDFLKFALGNNLWQPKRLNLWTLQWRYNERDSVSNYRRFDCSLNYVFRRRSKITSKLRVTGLYEGNSPAATDEFPSQRASNAENVFIRWRHHGILPWHHNKRSSTSHSPVMPQWTFLWWSPSANPYPASQRTLMLLPYVSVYQSGSNSPSRPHSDRQWRSGLMDKKSFYYKILPSSLGPCFN